MLHKKPLWHGLTFVFALVLCLCVTVGIILEQFSSNVDEFLGTRSSMLVSDDEDDTLYSIYKPDKNYLNSDGTGNSKALIQEAINLGEQEGAEGTVLLKNDGVLPLTSSATDKKKVTLLGLRSHTPLLGSGMGVKVQGPMITLEDALSRTTTDWDNPLKWEGKKKGSDMDVFSFKGANYELNPTTIEFYANDSSNPYSYNDRVAAMNVSDGAMSFYETSPKELESQCKDSFSKYNDAAIVVLGRPGSEASDYLPGGAQAGQGITEPLQLTTDEKGVLKVAKDNFSKVIVLINSCNAMEIDELKNDPQIDAILNISFPGAYGMLGVADVLCGTVSPSGGLADINAAQNMSAPAMQNMGEYTFSNYGTDITRSKSQWYIMEAESIYTGYRYYETRYEDTVLNAAETKAAGSAGVYNSKDGSWKYSDEVTYGFGYGLSYTTFSQEIQTDKVVVHDSAADRSINTITMEIPVKVTNTGDYAGKCSVQIYGQAPYKKGGLEKTAVELLGYAKTDTLAPSGQKGDSQTVTVNVDLQNIASYDSSLKNPNGGEGGYVMDAGKYYFAAGNGAHDALNNIILTKNSTAAVESEDIDRTGMDVSKLVYTYDFKPASGETDTTTFSRSKNGTIINNQLPYADFNYYQKDAVKYLTRADWSTFPTEYKDVKAPETMLNDLNGKYYTVKTNETKEASEFVWGSKETDYKFYELAQMGWDEPYWNDVLDQLTINEAMYLNAYGGPIFPGCASIGFEETQLTENNGNGVVFTFSQNLDPNAPWSMPSSEKETNSAWNGQVFGASPLLAATFNPEIALRRGEFVGNESLFLGVPIIWGPGLNTHRQAYNGRNCEYYSEDPILCGVVAEYFSYGCGEYGLLAAPKHFAFNDQETNRGGVAPFMTEQRAREVELRAYQIAIECPDMAAISKLAANPNSSYQGMYGVMTSFSKIGAVECTASRGLLTGILRDEWGFHGYTVTDIFDDTDLYSACVYAGITGYDIRGAQKFDTTTALGSSAMVTDKGQLDGIALNAQTYAGDATMQQSLKTNVKNLLWAFAQTNLMNRYSSSTHVVRLMTWWRALYISAIVIFAVLTAAGAVLYIISEVHKKKEA